MPTKFKDYYEVLGVARTATDKDIKAAFRKLARRHHPDVNGGDEAAVERFKEINEANEVLSDPEKRKRYDQLGPRWSEYEAWERAGKPGPDPFQGGGGFGPGRGGATYTTVDPGDLEEMFGTNAPFSDFFNQFFGGRQQQRGAQRVPARRGSHIEGDIDITLDEAFRGSPRTVDITDARGTRRVVVTVPAGIADGARVRAAGQGAPGDGGGAAGDILMRVHITPHPRFTRDGDDLRVRVAVPLATALLGGSVRVPTLAGRTVELKVPANTQNGTRLRLRGLGMPRLRGGGAGDLHAEVDVRLPVPLDEAGRAAAEALRQPES